MPKPSLAPKVHLRIGPLANALRIALASNPALTNRTTTITTLLITPLLSVIFLTAIVTAVGASDALVATYAAILVSFGITVLTGTVEQVTCDRQIGVAHEVISHGIWNPTYWIGKSLVPVILGIAPALITAVAAYLITGANSGDLLIKTLLLIPLAALVGALIGVAAGIGSLGMSNPYLISNLAGTVLLITAGVVIPLTLYPSWLVWIARLLPFTAVVEMLRLEATASTGSFWVLLLREIGLGVGWLTVGLILARIVVARIRAGQAEQVW